MTKMKRFTVMALICCLMLGLASTAYAADFDGDFSGSLNRTGSGTATTNPYVSPSSYINATTFMLLQPGTSNIASTVLTNVTSPGYKAFTYQPGYGGGSQLYQMGGHPSNMNYSAYYASPAHGVRNCIGKQAYSLPASPNFGGCYEKSL